MIKVSMRQYDLLDTGRAVSSFFKTFDRVWSRDGLVPLHDRFIHTDGVPQFHVIQGVLTKLELESWLSHSFMDLRSEILRILPQSQVK